MSNASASSSSGSYSVCSLPDTPSGTTSFSNDITYSGPFNPSPFKLLFLVNTGGHNDSLRNMSVGQPHLQYAIDSLIRLRAQCVSLNAIIEETNVYVANLAFNATASGPTLLILQGPMTVLPFPTNSERIERQLPTSVSRLGPLASDICDTDPNNPTFLRAAATMANPAPMVPKLEPPTNVDSIKPEPDSDSPSELLYPSDSTSEDSPPLYAQSIGVASASPSLPTEPQPGPSSTPLPVPPINPFDVDNEQLAPSTVPFLANRQFNPTFVSIQDMVRANPGVQIDTRTFTNVWAPASVWDNETVSKTAEQLERKATVDEVYEFLCALCAEWHTTAPATVQATVARSADYLRLGIFLGIAVSDDGRIDFLKRTIPGAHSLLTTISMGVTTTMTSTETENNETKNRTEVSDPDDLVPMFVGIPDHAAQEVTLPDR
uniref:Uncharacterized protein n=1 Tax=Moniliophthora roreri TaxID=221103 RepID=A0A0W0EYK5_MONRR